MPTVAVRKGHLNGGWVVEVKSRFGTTSRVRGVFLVGNGGIHEVGFAVSVQIINGHCVGNVRAEVGHLCITKRALSRCNHERDVLSVSIHHGDGVNVSVAANVSDVEIP